MEQTTNTPNAWHGTRQEARALLQAIRRHCACRALGDLCGAHRLLTSQEVIDGLLQARRNADRLRAAELAV